MSRENLAKRMAADICLTLESFLGLTSDVHFLAPELEREIDRLIAEKRDRSRGATSLERRLTRRVQRTVRRSLTGRASHELDATIEAAIRNGL